MGSMDGRENFKWRQLAQHQSMSQQRPHFSPHRKAKANNKRFNIRKIGISHVAFASVLLRENSSEEVDDYDNYYPRAQASRVM